MLSEKRIYWPENGPNKCWKIYITTANSFAIRYGQCRHDLLNAQLFN
jgi:hypothetical protein